MGPDGSCDVRCSAMECRYGCKQASYRLGQTTPIPPLEARLVPCTGHLNCNCASCRWDRTYRAHFGSGVAQGCICPPTAERTCQGALCPRRAIGSATGQGVG